MGRMLASLDSKRIDVVINQVTISDERKKYDFSTPYTVSGIQALVKKGNEGTIKTAADLKGKKWASVWGQLRRVAAPERAGRGYPHL
jgi:cystine transport system substrate-binding protein